MNLVLLILIVVDVLLACALLIASFTRPKNGASVRMLGLSKRTVQTAAARRQERLLAEETVWINRN